MTEPTVLRPNPRVFVVRATFRAGLFTSPLLLLGAAVAPTMELTSSLALTVLVPLWALFVAFTFVRRRIVFGKTRYLLYPRRIVLETGGLLSERAVDLQFANVTQTSLRLPFIEHKLYETGHVAIEAAGSAAAEVVFESIDDPRGAFDTVADALRANGFSMQKNTLVQQERPGVIGALYALSASAGSVAIGLVFLLPTFLDILAAAAAQDDLSALVDSLSSGELFVNAIDAGAIVAGVFLVLLVGGFTIATLALRTMDILKRTYTLYDDVIEYEDGFLTRHQSFIPLENLSDVELNESIVQRLLSVSTLKISCQGVGADILLAALPNGTQFKTNVERLIDEAGRVEAPEPAREADVAPGSDAAPRHGPRTDRPQHTLPSVVGKFDWKRGIAGPVAGAFVLLVGGLLFLLLLVVFNADIGAANGIAIALPLTVVFAASTAPGIVKVLFQAAAITYTVDERKVTHSYELLSRKQLEFTIDKISGVTIVRNPIDRLMKTARVSFRSIGSAEEITFQHLANAEDVIDGVLQRMGIDAKGEHQAVPAKFSLGALARSLDFVSLLCFAAIASSAPIALVLDHGVIVGLVVAAMSVAALIARVAFLHMHYREAGVDIGDRWVRVRHGWLVRKTFYAPLSQIRGINTTRYIAEARGLFVVRSGGGATARLSFVPGVEPLLEQLDDRLARFDGAAALDTAPVSERRPVVMSALIRLVIVIVVFPPLLIWLLVAIRRIRYELQRSRVVRTSGVIFTHRSTILLSRIDHLATSRGVANRLTGTRAIGIRTLGSQGTDMAIEDVPDGQAFYEQIEAEMRG